MQGHFTGIESLESFIIVRKYNYIIISIHHYHVTRLSCYDYNYYNAIIIWLYVTNVWKDHSENWFCSENVHKFDNL